MFRAVFLLLFGLVFVGSAGAQSADSAMSYAGLMQVRSAIKSEKARFTEQRRMSLLTEPLKSSGLLSFTAPQTVIKQTLEPFEEILTVRGDRVTVEREKENSLLSFDLQDHPVALLSITALKAVLSGDGSVLPKLFEMNFSSQQGYWELRLRPLSPDDQAQVRAIRFTGQAALITKVEWVEASGDQTTMVIRPIKNPEQG